MSAHNDYWQHSVKSAAEECDLELTREQLLFMARMMESASEHQGAYSYAPSQNYLISDVEKKYEKKLEELRNELEKYKGNAEKTVRRCVGLNRGDRVGIDQSGNIGIFG